MPLKVDGGHCILPESQNTLKAFQVSSSLYKHSIRHQFNFPLTWPETVAEGK